MMEFAIPCSLIDNDGVDLVKLLVSVGFSSSNSEARRLISQGAVKLNGGRIYSLKLLICTMVILFRQGNSNI